MVLENHCENNGAEGIIFDGTTSGTASGNTSQNNRLVGIVVGDNADITLENNIVLNNKSGIFFNGSGIAQSNQVEDNDTIGISVSYHASPTLKDNLVRYNGLSGIYLNKNAAQLWKKFSQPQQRTWDSLF